jgi:uncharacterized protein (TIGR03067 family)
MQEHPDERPLPAEPDGASPRPSDARIQKGSLRLFRVGGIDVFVHWSWLIVAYFRIQSRASPNEAGLFSYRSPAWNAIEYVAIFVIVLLHEFGHVLACRSVGGIANRIVLWPLGGVALVQPPPRPGAFLWSLAAGPLVNLVLVPPTVGLVLLSHFAGWGTTAPDVGRFIIIVAATNALMLGFNLLPIYPLDGGQILQGLLWLVLGRARSLMIVTALSFVTGLVLLVLALKSEQWWLGLIAGFAVLASLAGFAHARALLRVLRARPHEGVACPSCGKAPPAGAFWACPRCYTRLDPFEQGGTCPTCSTPQDTVRCFECGHPNPYADWFGGVVAVEEPPAPATEPSAARPRRPVPRSVSPAARAGCAVVLALFGLMVGLAANGGERPIDLIVWAAGGALFGATAGVFLLRGWQTQRAREQVVGTWRLIEEDGNDPPADAGAVSRLILRARAFEERTGDEPAVRGPCWIDPTTEPASITFTPKTGPDRGKPCQGIYRLDGKFLTICLALPGGRRPTEFVAVPGVQRLLVYRRGPSPGAVARRPRRPDPSEGRHARRPPHAPEDEQPRPDAEQRDDQ